MSQARGKVGVPADVCAEVQHAALCVSQVALGFREGYDIGRRVHSARQDRDRIQTELDVAISTVAAAKPEDRASAQLEVELKRNELFAAQNRLNDAERAADFFRLRLAGVR